MTADRYKVEDDAFDHVHGVLRNKLGLTTERDIAQAEIKGLVAAFDFAYTNYETDQLLSSTDVCDLHRVFLGELYEWAGAYRTVNMSSDVILWCSANYIENQMAAFDQLLKSLTPFSQSLGIAEVSQRIAQIHAELILIHPFREGNGRLVRLFCNVLLSQGWFENVDEDIFYHERERYFTSIREAYANGTYTELTAIYRELLEG